MSAFVINDSQTKNEFLQQNYAIFALKYTNFDSKMTISNVSSGSFLPISIIFSRNHIQRSHNLGLGHLSYNS